MNHDNIWIIRSTLKGLIDACLLLLRVTKDKANYLRNLDEDTFLPLLEPPPLSDLEA